MKMYMNTAMIILTLFIPGTVLILISSIYNLELGAYVPTIVMLSILFACELIAIRRDKSFIWAIFSRSTRDKIVFSCCLIILFIFVSLPIYLKIYLWWIFSIFLFGGYLITILVFKLFASQTMKDGFAKSPNIFR